MNHASVGSMRGSIWLAFHSCNLVAAMHLPTRKGFLDYILKKATTSPCNISDPPQYTYENTMNHLRSSVIPPADQQYQHLQNHQHRQFKNQQNHRPTISTSDHFSQISDAAPSKSSESPVRLAVEEPEPQQSPSPQPVAFRRKFCWEVDGHARLQGLGNVPGLGLLSYGSYGL